MAEVTKNDILESQFDNNDAGGKDPISFVLNFDASSIPQTGDNLAAMIESLKDSFARVPEDTREHEDLQKFAEDAKTALQAVERIPSGWWRTKSAMRKDSASARGKIDQVLDGLIPFLNAVKQKHEIDSELRELRERQQKTDEHQRAISATNESLQNELERLRADAIKIGVEQSGKASGYAEIGHQADYFKDASNRCWRSACMWGVAMVATAFLALLYVFWLDEHLNPLRTVMGGALAQTFNFLKWVTGQVLVIGAFFFVMFFFMRNYMIKKHHLILNLHRCNTLTACRCLLRTSSDSTMDNVLLTQTAHAIFAPPDTGYVRGEKTDVRQSPPPLAEQEQDGAESK